VSGLLKVNLIKSRLFGVNVDDNFLNVAAFFFKQEGFFFFLLLILVYQWGQT